MRSPAVSCWTVVLLLAIPAFAQVTGRVEKKPEAYTPLFEIRLGQRGQAADCPTCTTKPPTKVCCEPGQYGSCLTRNGACNCFCFSLPTTKDTDALSEAILEGIFGKEIDLPAAARFDLVRQAFAQTAKGTGFVTSVPGVGSNVTITLAPPKTEDQRLLELGLIKPLESQFYYAMPGTKPGVERPPV